MNAFKKSEKPTHKLYSSKVSRKEFVTNKEFAQDLSIDSVDLNPSFSDLQDSFFSHNSSKIDNEIIDQLQLYDISPAEMHKSTSLVIIETPVVRKNKEEETNYTTKPLFGSVKLEKEEFSRNWLCQSCMIIETGDSNKRCSLF